MEPEWNHEPGEDDATMLGLREYIETPLEEKNDECFSTHLIDRHSGQR